MTVNGNSIKGVAAGVFSSAGQTEADRAEHVFVRRYLEIDLTDAATAATAAAERTVHRAQVSGRLLSAYGTPPVAITFNAANFFTATIGRRTAGAARVTMATIASSAVSDVAHVPRAFTPTAANVKYAAGDAITVELTKAGTGVAISAATAPYHVSLLIEEDT